jgi:hypothetical protein
MRFFRTENDAVYEQTRMGLDAAWGLPNDRLTVTCIAPAATAPRDAQGRIVLAVEEEWCQWSPADEILPQLLADGLVVEISRADYDAAIYAEI